MARGDITFFEEALDDAFFGGWATTDDIKLAICDNTSAPTAAQATPALGDFTQVGAAGTYTTGGTSIGAWDALSTEAGGYERLALERGADPAILYVDLGGPVDMSAGSLTVTWNASGIFTIS